MNEQIGSGEESPPTSSDGGAADEKTAGWIRDEDREWDTSIVPSWKSNYSDEFAEKVDELSRMLDREVWLAIEGDFDPSVMHPFIIDQFKRKKSALPRRPIAVLVDSYGGQADAAYALASLIRRRCGSFLAVVPRVAKSAATLFVLGAEEIILGEDAELGPLDVQFRDFDVEETWVSALDTVQAVEQLEQSAMDVAVKMLKFLGVRTKKKYSVLLEHALHFSAEITQPLFDKIDAVRYSRQHRLLREAQDYAERLLQPKFNSEQAKAIAKDLVRNYPTHDFIIDREEAKKVGVIFDEKNEREVAPVGLHVRKKVDPKLEELLDWFVLNLPRACGVGKLAEV